MPTARYRAILAVLAILAGVSPLMATGAGPTIEGPVPRELRDRVADPRRLIRPTDAEAALGAERIVDGDLRQRCGLLTLRVEADCRDASCVTVTARVKENGPIPEPTPMADKPVVIADDGDPLRGGPAHPIRLEGAGSAGLDLWLRPAGWVVEDCGGGFPSGEERAQRPPTPTSSSPTFGGSGRWPGLDP